MNRKTWTSTHPLCTLAPRLCPDSLEQSLLCPGCNRQPVKRASTPWLITSRIGKTTIQNCRPLLALMHRSHPSRSEAEPALRAERKWAHPTEHSSLLLFVLNPQQGPRPLCERHLPSDLCLGRLFDPLLRS